METKQPTHEQLLADENLLSTLIMRKLKIACYTFYTGGDHVRYSFWWNGKELFSGKDFKPSILYGIDSLVAMAGLLGRFAVQEGDTDKDYFKNYTPLQIEWSNSAECDHLKEYINDYFNSDSEYHTSAKRTLKRAFKTY